MRIAKHGLVIEWPEREDWLFDQVANVFLEHDLEVKTVVDVGAHWGVLSLVAAKVKGARVLALEPWPANYRWLVQNVLQNGLLGLVTPLPLALAPPDLRRLELSAFGDHYAGMVSSHYAAHAPKKHTVPTISCQGLRLLARDCFDAPIDYLKIDVEGAEHDFLTSDAALLLADTRFLNLELHLTGPENPLKRWRRDSTAGRQTSKQTLAFLESVGFKDILKPSTKPAEPCIRRSRNYEFEEF